MGTNAPLVCIDHKPWLLMHSSRGAPVPSSLSDFQKGAKCCSPTHPSLSSLGFRFTHVCGLCQSAVAITSEGGHACYLPAVHVGTTQT